MRLRTAVLALALGLGIVGSAAADDSASWWMPRWMSPWSGTTAKAEKSDADTPKTPLVTDAMRRKRAKADLDRRQEVLLKLREIATAANDEETLQQIDQLDRRAWSLYVAATNMRVEPPRASAEPAEKKEGR